MVVVVVTGQYTGCSRLCRPAGGSLPGLGHEASICGRQQHACTLAGLEQQAMHISSGQQQLHTAGIQTNVSAKKADAHSLWPCMHLAPAVVLYTFIVCMTPKARLCQQRCTV